MRPFAGRDVIYQEQPRKDVWKENVAEHQRSQWSVESDMCAEAGVRALE